MEGAEGKVGPVLGSLPGFLGVPWLLCDCGCGGEGWQIKIGRQSET
jgi:hypothetical protein